jgi:hypothetical protein
MALEVINMMNSTKRVISSFLALVVLLTGFALAGSGDFGQGRDRNVQPINTPVR